MALAEDILNDLDEAVLDVGHRYFTSTADALDPMLTIVTTLLIVLVGINMALGAYRMSTRDAWQLVTRIVLVFIFARSWANFGVLYDALSSGAGSLALSFFDGDTPNPAAAMDQFAVQMSDVTDGAARAVSSIMRGLVSAALFIILSLLMAAYVLIVGFSKIMIAFLLGVAPIAMIATIFERTKTLFEAWLTAFVGYLLYPIAAAAVIGAVVSMADSQFTEQDSIEELSMILGLLCVTFVASSRCWRSRLRPRTSPAASTSPTSPPKRCDWSDGRYCCRRRLRVPWGEGGGRDQGPRRGNDLGRADRQDARDGRPRPRPGLGREGRRSAREAARHRNHAGHAQVARVSLLDLGGRDGGPRV